MILMAPESVTNDVFPEELREHDLFRDSATFRKPMTPLLAERMDVRMRILRNQPSSGDSTSSSILQGMSRLHDQARKWIEHARNGNRSLEADLLPRLDRLQHMLTSPLSGAMLDRSLKGAIALLPADLRVYAPQPGMTRQEMGDRLGLISILLLEKCLRQNRSLYRRYVKRLYATMDSALAYNATTDIVRLWPVLQWIRELLTGQRRSGCAYADVGCATAEGAPGILEAVDLLRVGGPCSQIHGIDVVAPSHQLAVDMARRGILLYTGDPINHPLPRRYDVILLANVHRHLTRDLQARMIQHLCGSLNEYGWLFINWRFSDTRSPCLCLEKRRGRLWAAAERNCV